MVGPPGSTVAYQPVSPRAPSPAGCDLSPAVRERRLAPSLHEPMCMKTFEALDTDQLVRAWGGVKMKLTQYGYPNDPYSDSETRKGNGAYHRLVPHESLAMTDSGLAALGLTRAEVRHSPFWVDIKLRGGGTIQRRIDDRAPERDMRADLYQPGGFDRSLPDYADVQLHHR
jgi:hypothetical protein